MKIEPKHNVKKPAYVISTAVLATTLLTGCPGIKKQIEEIDGLRTAGIVAIMPAIEEVEEAVETKETVEEAVETEETEKTEEMTDESDVISN